MLEKGKDNPIHYPGENINAVDETAAGDSFRAAFCVAYLKSQDINKSTIFANKAGSLAATKFGAYESMPHLTEIRV